MRDKPVGKDTTHCDVTVSMKMRIVLPVEILRGKVFFAKTIRTYLKIA
jgi:hypothetical protein